MPRTFSIEKLVEDTRQNGMKLRRVLEDEPEKAIKQLEKIVDGGNASEIYMMVRILNFCLENHPRAASAFSRRLGNSPNLLSHLWMAGLQLMP